MEVKFKQLSPKKLAEFVFDMKECISAEDLHREGSCFYFDIPKKIANEIVTSAKLTKRLRKKIISLIGNYKKIDKNIIKNLQNFWDKNLNDLFFNEMEKYMPGCSSKRYTCYVSDKIVGSYFERENEITIDFNGKEDISKVSFFVAEEILHLVYWRFWKKIFNKNLSLEERFDIGSKKINGWLISEIIPEYLLVKNKNFEKFGWNKIDRSKGYKWIRKLRKKIDPLWGEKKDFSEFVIKVHSLAGFKS